MFDFSVFTLVIFLSTFLSNYKYEVNFFDKHHTNYLKGFSILTVLWAHLGSAYGINGIQWVAGIGVAIFLICSGYGLRESYKKSGLKNFWRKRIITVVIPYWVIYLIGAFFTSKNYNFELVKNILLFERANWYVRYIIIIYLIYWVIMKIVQRFKIENKNLYIIILIVCLLSFTIESLFFAQASAPSLKARQVVSFPLGLLMSDYYEKFYRMNTKKRVNKYFLILGCLSLLVFVFSQVNFVKNFPYLISNSISLVTVLPMSVVVIWLSLSFKKLFFNYTFDLLGKISYEIFLVQYMSRNIVQSNNPWTLYLCLFATILLSYIFNRVYRYLKLKI